MNEIVKLFLSMDISQICIILFSCISIFLFSTKKYYRYGFIVGICGQPFWLYASYTSKQLGVFIVAVWFTFSYIRGIRNHFLSISKGELNEQGTEKNN